MRAHVYALCLAWLGAASSAARADRTPVARSPDGAADPGLSPIALDDVPAACRAVATQARAADRAVALDARIALASCIAAHRLETLPRPCDCGESMLALDEAVAPAVALLDEVIANGDALTALLAEHAKGELYTDLRVRMRATIPAPTGGPDAIALRDARLAVLDDLIEPWRARATAAYDHVIDLARHNPELIRNPAVRAAIESSRARLGLVAGR